ncbi:uncharacterized protein LOC122662914 [Telopea speciosissima]|uniref:uncharacterized protein LOC122662914 n=1 Tax=Telopea speciosissima TaxID=54955 RepID=UPI001CC49D3C|nr:uncharacterized protein LOC122662914 [Telopea speciosissima]
MTSSSNINYSNLKDDKKLNGDNYVDWVRGINLFLTIEALLSVTEKVTPPILHYGEIEEEQTYKQYWREDSKAKLLILRSVEKSIVDTIKNLLTAGSMLDELKEVYGKQSWHVHHQLTTLIHNTKLIDDTLVVDHVMKMKSLFFEPESLGTEFTLQYKRDVIPNSLPSVYSSFTLNLRMNKIDVNLTELGNMLSEVESSFKKQKTEVLTTDVKSSLEPKGSKKKKVRVNLESLEGKGRVMGFKLTKKLNMNEVHLRMGTGFEAMALVVGTIILELDSTV